MSIVLVLTCLMAIPAAGAAQTGSEVGPASADAIVERIRQLEEQIEALLEGLSPGLRREVERRLAEAPLELVPESADPPVEAIVRESVEGDSVAVTDAEVSTAPPLRSGSASQAATDIELSPSAPETEAMTDAVPDSVRELPPVEVSEMPAKAPDPEPPVVEPRPVPACNTLIAFDSNDDGAISGADRYWRHLHLWLDRDGDHQVDDKNKKDKEVEHLYEHSIADFTLSLRRFGTQKGAAGSIDTGEYVVFYLVSKSTKRSEEGVLVVDADGLRRSGGPSLETVDGAVLEGMQPFRRGLAWRGGDGVVTVLDCP